jgi:hypothetical protein
MTTSTSVPVTITAEAATRIAELGMQSAVEQMIERAKQTIPGLKALDVILEPAWDTGPDDYLTIQGFSDREWDPEDASEREYDRWAIRTFPPEVTSQIVLSILYRTSHER